MPRILTHRRSFIKLGIAGIVAGIASPKIALAKNSEKRNVLKTPIAGNILYTSDNEGRWKNKSHSHTPVIKKNGNSLQITTNHSMDDYNHYIIKHRIFDKNFVFIDERMFVPMDGKAISEYDIKGRSGVLYAMSVCNIHDSWISEFEL